MPLRWLRRLRGGGKSAGSPAHPPARKHGPQRTLLEGKCDSRKPLSQGRGTPRGLPRRLRRARDHCHTPRLAREPPVLRPGHGTLVPPSRRSGGHTTCIDSPGKRGNQGCRPAQSRESKPREWFSDRAHASAPRSATREPPVPAKKVLLTPLPDSFFYQLGFSMCWLSCAEEAMYSCSTSCCAGWVT